MSDPRVSGVLLLLVASLAFVGSTRALLPAITFFPALLLFAIGAFKLLRGQGEVMRRRAPVPTSSHRAAGRVQTRTQRAPSPSPAASPPEKPGPAPRPPARMVPRDPSPSPDLADPIGLDDGIDGFVVSADVSFPMEIQREDALASQHRKLDQLRAEGILSHEEYARARAKLLG